MRRTAWFSGLIVIAIVSMGTQCDQTPKVDENDWRDRVLPDYFEQPIVDLLDDVPMFYADLPFFAGFAVGDDWGSRLVSVAYGLGNLRQVIITFTEEDYPVSGPGVIFHEYIHQSDYDGILSRALFIERLEQMRIDEDHADTAAELDAFLATLLEGGFVQDVPYIYDDGINREAMAYLIEFWADGYFELPDYMLEVYEGVVLPDPPSRHDGFKLSPDKLLQLPVRPCTTGFHVGESETEVQP